MLSINKQLVYTYVHMGQIGKNLKNARIQAGLTQKEVESSLELRELSMKDYETGRLKLPMEMAAKFAKLFNIDLNTLISQTNQENPGQLQELMSVSQLLRSSEIAFIFLDPVIRAQLEEYSDKLFEHSVFDLMTIPFTENQKKILAEDFLKTLGSLMGADNRVTETEMTFFTHLTTDLGLRSRVKPISRAITAKHLPIGAHFNKVPALKHLLVWIMFFLAKSDGEITHEEIDYIEECAESLKVNRTNYLTIKSHFKGWI